MKMLLRTWVEKYLLPSTFYSQNLDNEQGAIASTHLFHLQEKRSSGPLPGQPLGLIYLPETSQPQAPN